MGITKTIQKERRKNYSLDPIRSRELAQHALDMSNKIGRVVPRQKILDTLIESLKDEKIYTKVVAIIEKK